MTFPLVSQRSANPVARLGGSHGYRLDGDVAHLNADIVCDEARLTGQDWALQLWTDEGVKIAELALGLLHPNGSGNLHVAGSATALPPAGEGPHVLSLLLVSGRDGQLDCIEDGASYAQAVSFVQPRLRGTVCSGFATDEITFDIARIENPRDADNLSGTLALELWSLDTQYTGGAWSGVPIATLVLGTLAGQSAWTDCHYTAHAAPLPDTGFLTLMLREWTPAGYITRDFRTLGRPTLAQAAPAEVAPVKATPADKTGKTQTAAKIVGKSTPKAAAQTKGKATPATPATVSINTASAAELGAVKGISKAIAEAIVAGRPYATLDDVVRAKGMGPKLLDKVRANLTL